MPPPPVYEPIFGYAPSSDTFDYADVDLDFRAMTTALSARHFRTAQSIYEHGGFSGSYARFVLPPLPRVVRKSTVVNGATAAGAPVSGLVLEDAAQGGTILRVLYLGDDCHVGGLPNPVTSGCFANATSISVSGHGKAFDHSMTVWLVLQF